MQVKTKNETLVEVDEKQIIKIPSGLFGFEEYTDFALIDSEYQPFIWLQSLQDYKLAFLLIDPFVVCPEYQADIDDKLLSSIGITDPAQVLVLTIVTIPHDGGDVTANFQGPLVINRGNRNCVQAVLSDSSWTTKFNIMESVKKREGK